MNMISSSSHHLKDNKNMNHTEASMFIMQEKDLFSMGSNYVKDQDETTYGVRTPNDLLITSNMELQHMQYTISPKDANSLPISG